MNMNCINTAEDVVRNSAVLSLWVMTLLRSQIHIFRTDTKWLMPWTPCCGFQTFWTTYHNKPGQEQLQGQSLGFIPLLRPKSQEICPVFLLIFLNWFHTSVVKFCICIWPIQIARTGRIWEHHTEKTRADPRFLPKPLLYLDLDQFTLSNLNQKQIQWVFFCSMATLPPSLIKMVQNFFNNSANKQTNTKKQMQVKPHCWWNL